MTSPAFEPLRQRADYTHKYNLDSGRHGWLRLTPAYSVRMVEELMGNTPDHLRVLDPFCGTATTALSAAYHGHSAVTTDINPFLIWFGRAKTAHYPPAVIAEARAAAAQVLDLVAARQLPPSPPPPIHNIERWWTTPALAFLCRLQAAIDATVPNESAVADLLRVAFCRTLMACSNAAFNHQSMSFKDSPQPELDLQPDYASLFRNHIAFVLAGAQENPAGTAQVLLHDARALSKLDRPPFNLVVTSPPYANRMSYIRELRPYMYWLRFLTNGRDAGELDWQAIGGTWGIATSRLNDWQPNITVYTANDLEETLARMANPCNKNGALLATYIRKYCTDMAQHFAELRAILAAGASLHYIVGNSTFYGELLSVEKIYARMMQAAGFTNIQIRPIRKRNSKKALVEFDVSARYA
jgi:DNA modification methylase